MGTVAPAHDFRRSHNRTQRKSGGNAFGDSDDVRLTAKMLHSKHLSGSSHAGLNFVSDEQNPVLLRRHDIASLTLDGLKHNTCYFRGVEHGLEENVLNELCAGRVTPT